MAAFFEPICEFYPTSASERHDRSFLNEAISAEKRLINLLKSTKGVYSFYNSELEIIYLGKTKNNLWDDMKQTYNSEKSHYRRYRVSHPRDVFTQTKNGFVRKINLQDFFIWEAAVYFSAHSIDQGMIDDIEALLIRMIPNDILNHKMEGNGRLTEYREPKKQ